MSEKRDFAKEYKHLVTAWLSEDGEDPRVVLANIFSSVKSTALIFGQEYPLEQVEKALNVLLDTIIQKLRNELKNKKNE